MKNLRLKSASETQMGGLVWGFQSLWRSQSRDLSGKLSARRAELITQMECTAG